MAATSFPNPPATLARTTQLDPRPCELCWCLEEDEGVPPSQCNARSLPLGCARSEQEPLLLETRALTPTRGQHPDQQQGGHQPGAEKRARCCPPQTPDLSLALRDVQRAGSNDWGCDRHLRSVSISGGTVWYLEESKWTFSGLYGMASPSLFKL